MFIYWVTEVFGGSKFLLSFLKDFNEKAEIFEKLGNEWTSAMN